MAEIEKRSRPRTPSRSGRVAGNAAYPSHWYIPIAPVQIGFRSCGRTAGQGSLPRVRARRSRSRRSSACARRPVGCCQKRFQEHRNSWQEPRAAYEQTNRSGGMSRSGKISVVEHEQEFTAVLKALNRMRDSGGEIPDVARAYVIDKVAALRVDDRNPGASGKHCQCISRMPPGVSRMSTAAKVVATGSSRTVTSRAQPPWRADCGRRQKRI
jgi:hypothetical protein